MDLKCFVAESQEDAIEQFQIYMTDKYPNHKLENIAIIEI
jgi:hypothetical protein